MDFGLLGSLRVASRGRVLAVPSSKQRAVLAMLLLHPNRTVSVPKLIDAVWGDEPPASARGLIQTYVWRLRALLTAEGEAATRLDGGPCGYLLRVDSGEPDTLDTGEFEHLLRLGTLALDAGRDADALRTLRSALALWRGEPAADVTLHGRADGMLRRLAEERIGALEQRVEAELRLGLHENVVGELRQLTVEHPLRERMTGQLMLALYRCGRQAEALAAFRTLRANLTEELGVDPGREVGEVFGSILRADVALTADPLRQGARHRILPRQLPAAVRHFVGRTPELGALDRVAQQLDDATGPAALCAISGTAGIGKTALAVQWAHQAARRFPDGQLYVNLRGFDPSGSPVEPAEAIRGFLDAVHVPAERIPAGLAAQAALYRSLLATRRVLIVLDNARDSDHVRPLLPGGPACMTVITSRDVLDGLVATHGAQPVPLAQLGTDEALEVLHRRLGPERVGQEPGATARLVELCARLPLALNVAAARAAAQPAFPLAKLAGQLEDMGGRLDELDTGDQASLRATFSWSYENLDPATARMYRLLGLHPGPDISVSAAAGLAELAEPRARKALTALNRAHLLVEHAPDRFAFHDLLRAYAAERVRDTDGEHERDNVLRRVLDHYLHSGRRAARLLNPTWDPVLADPPGHAASVEQFADHDQALAWFEAEHRVLLAITGLAVAEGFDAHAWRLAHTLLAFLDRRAHWHDLAAVAELALTAAQRLADRGAQACAHRDLARACLRLGAFDAAHRHLTSALALSTGPEESAERALVHRELALVCEQQGDRREALGHARKVLSLLRAEGHEVGVANALNTVGWFHTLLGDHEEAMTYCRRALDLQRGLGNRVGEAGTWDSLGYIHYQLDEYDSAIECYQQAVDLYAKISDHYYEAGSLVRLGDARQASGAAAAASEDWMRALGILQSMQHPDAEHLAERLHRTPHPPPP